MAHQSLFKRRKKTLRKTQCLYHELKESQGAQKIKILEFQVKLHDLIEQNRIYDPIERLKKIDICDIPMETLKKWIVQINSGKYLYD